MDTEFVKLMDYIRGQVSLETETTEFKRLHNNSLSRRSQSGDRQLGAGRSLTLPLDGLQDFWEENNPKEVKGWLPAPQSGILRKETSLSESTGSFGFQLQVCIIFLSQVEGTQSDERFQLPETINIIIAKNSFFSS